MWGQGGDPLRPEHRSTALQGTEYKHSAARGDRRDLGHKQLLGGGGRGCSGARHSAGLEGGGGSEKQGESGRTEGRGAVERATGGKCESDSAQSRRGWEAPSAPSLQAWVLF